MAALGMEAYWLAEGAARRARVDLLWYVLCMGAVLVGGVQHCPGDTEQPDSPQTIRLLRAAYSSTLSRLQDIRLNMENESVSSPAWLAERRNLDPSVALKERTSVLNCYIRKGIREWLSSGTNENPPTEARADAFEAFDGQYWLTYYSTKGSSDTTTQKGRGLRLRRDVGIFDSERGPGPAALFGCGSMPDAVLRSPNVAVSGVPEKIGDLEAYKASAEMDINKVKYRVTYWLCPERSGLPLKMEIRELDGRLLKERETREFLQLPDGGWFPKTVVHRDYRTKEGVLEVIGTDTFTATSVQLRPQVDEAKVFDTRANSLPPGTLVQDDPSGLEFTVGEGPVSDEHLQRLIRDTVDRLDRQAPEGPRELSPQGETAPVPLFSDGGMVGTGLPASVAAQEGRSALRLAIGALGAALLVCLLGALLLRLKKNRDRLPRSS